MDRVWSARSTEMWPGWSTHALDASPASLTRFSSVPFWVMKANWPCKPGVHTATQTLPCSGAGFSGADCGPIIGASLR
jgi:hypothetical protein